MSRQVLSVSDGIARHPELHLREEWHEDIGTVLWWKFPIEEAPYVGSPLDLGQEVLIKTEAFTFAGELDPSNKKDMGVLRVHVGGWPGYHTHWTRIEIPEAPK